MAYEYKIHITSPSENVLDTMNRIALYSALTAVGLSVPLFKKLSLTKRLDGDFDWEVKTTNPAKDQIGVLHIIAPATASTFVFIDTNGIWTMAEMSALAAVRNLLIQLSLLVGQTEFLFNKALV